MTSKRPQPEPSDTADSPSEITNRHWILAVILILFVGVAALYNISTPIYETPDELEHVAFVVWLADGQGLPVVDPETPGPWKQEGTQPPLYYWIASVLLGGLPHQAADRLAELNPYAGIGDPQRPDNKNQVLHAWKQESWPFQENVAFVHLARGLSTLMAMGTLGAIYCLGRRAFPARPGIALGMTGLVAFLPQFLFLSSSVNNDNLVILIATWVLVLLTSWIRSPKLPGWLALSGMGILLGLAVLAKYSGVLLWPLAAGTLFWLAWRERQLRWLLPAGVIVAGLALALCGWWFVRNEQLYGDLGGFSAHLEIMGTRPQLPSGLDAWREFRGFRYSFWALFGWFNILAPDPFYWTMDALTVLGLVGLGTFLIRSWRQTPPWTRRVFVLLVAWMGLVVIGVLRWTIWTPASQGRLLYPALGAIALFLVLGWAELIPRRLRGPVSAAALLGWLVWAVLCPFLIIRPAYALPQRSSSLDHLDLTLSEVHVRFDECCELLGYVPPAQAAHPGDRVPLTLVWRALGTTDRNYNLYVHAATASGQILGQVDTYHGGGIYPTSQWLPGEIIADTVYVPIPQTAAGPALLRFNIGLHAGVWSEPLPAFAADGQELDNVFAGEVALLPSQWPEVRVDPTIDTVFGQQVELAGVEFSQTVVQPGEVVTVTLQWNSLITITEDYTGFVHLSHPAGRDVAQDDHQPMNGYFPTRLWTPGAVVFDPYRLELPDDLEAGTYEVWGGMYSLGSGKRLQAVARQTGELWTDDLVRIGTLEVIPDEE